MVQPGSFYKTGLMPGTYNMIAVMENGREILLPDPVEVGIEPNYRLRDEDAGSIFADTLRSEELIGGEYTILANYTIELIDFDLGKDAQPVLIETDDEGNFSYGPLASGFYQWRVDIDNDGWYEVEHNFTTDSDTTNITLNALVPLMNDVEINLNDGGNEVELNNRTITFKSTESTDLNPIVVTATSDENGVVYAEIGNGNWIISDETDEEFVLWHEINLDNRDIVELPYAVSVWINGTAWVIPELETLLNDPELGYETPYDVDIDLREKATNTVTVTARSGNIVLESRTDSNGNYSLHVLLV